MMCAGAFALNPTAVNVSAQVPTTLQLSMSKPTVDFGGGALSPGNSASDSVTATVNSNKLWSLKVHKDQDLTSGAFTIPSTDLMYTSTTTQPTHVKNLVGTATPFSTTDASVCGNCDRGNNLDVTISYSLNVPWDVEPGTYTATHTYTATQP